MKDFLINLCLVGLFVFLLNTTLNDFHVEKELFENNKMQFEEKISNNQATDSNVGMIVDYEDNGFSILIKEISAFCIKTIETIVLIISNFISMLL